MKALIKEFKEFISRGNVMDMAVGVIIGGAFTAIVNSLVNDMLMPLLSLLTGGFDFSGLCIALGEGENAATINYGSFISAIINFLLIAAGDFLIIKQSIRFPVRRKKKLRHRPRRNARIVRNRLLLMPRDVLIVLQSLSNH